MIEILERVIWVIFSGGAGFIVGCFYGKKQKWRERDTFLSLCAQREAAVGVLHRLADFLDIYAEDLSRVIFEDDDEEEAGGDKSWAGSVDLGEITNKGKAIDEDSLLKPEDAMSLDAADLAEIDRALKDLDLE